MARKIDTITSLIEQSRDLETLAQAVQGDKVIVAAAGQIEDLVNLYQEWLATALTVVPEEPRLRLRQEYEGNWHSNKIKAFLEAPGAVSVVHRSADPQADVSLFPYWLQPYDTSFRNPLLAQRQVLQEARQQLLGEGHGEEIALVERLCRGFGEFLIPLRNRQRGRPSWIVEDEYDVQDVLHGLLSIFFADVRSEDVSPQRGGSASRIDFILKAERIAVEAKMTRVGLTLRKVSDELIVDIERYQSHPDCDAFVALVYDPDRRIGNPKALEDDLSGEKDGMTIRVVVTR
ncbi:MAG TPA: hypothetical protein VNF75_02515 [Candidatus Dormibacteraeota bacterium]|nr:hypothetical protein [Candidatus Dormibacteraeota bacterium]